MTTTVLKATDLCKTFSNESVQQHVLKNLNLEIRKGDFTVIMGDSGAGKSTLLYALSGMDRPSLGAILFGNEDISHYSDDKLALFRRKHCGFVFQQVYLMDSMSVLDNVLTAGLLTGQNRRKLNQNARELLKQVGIEPKLWNKFPNQLSGGEKQRVALVRSVINEPEILFADEPTGALNSQNTAAVLDILTEMNRRGQSIVMVTHTVAAAERGNRILYLRDGVICDEITLSPYEGQNQERHKQLRAFLTDMGW
jgi:putative ABC transport system ATP-binding protein